MPSMGQHQEAPVGIRDRRDKRERAADSMAKAERGSMGTRLWPDSTMQRMPPRLESGHSLPQVETEGKVMSVVEAAVADSGEAQADNLIPIVFQTGPVPGAVRMAS